MKFSNCFGFEVDHNGQYDSLSVAYALEEDYANAHKWGIGECLIVVNDKGVGYIYTDASYDDIKNVSERVYIYSDAEDEILCGRLR